MSKSKKRVRGFTLIELIIALFILALSSTVLVTAYVSAYSHVVGNNELTDRMSEQQKYIENKKSKNGSNVDVFNALCDTNITNAYSGVTTGSIYVDLKCTHDENGGFPTGKDEFRINCVMYTLKNLDYGDGTVVADDDQLNVDFKYFEGSNAKN
ncbi:MAG: prepilin-type N-terminal cleavage/methylation domain-containing protein [Oscillospiraceae bacterium]|nr:prepilin-type N-terminal cleavage/methylation domain-containing protein [Oscillospiraceae bacterium]MDY6208693.1 prepilin-type N-terminal cleavage/methylation domain-containing protein [Oscillospiraceae bacterium]